jgi:UDP-N-acetylglucosamine 3-dehydrogenase
MPIPDSSTSGNDVIRAAVIGYGVMGRNHTRILRSFPEINVVGVCDPALREDIGVPVYGDCTKLFAEQSLDLAVIAVPTPLHHAVVSSCVERGISVFIEKPVTATVAEARSVLKMVSSARVKAAVGHVERFNPVVQALKRELAARELFSISFTRVGHMPPRIADVGVLTDLAVHDIDLVRFVTGKAITHSSIYKSRKINDHHEDCANVSFELEGNVLATITTNWLTPFKRRKIEVTTQEGYFEADLIAQELREFSAYKDDDTFLTRSCPVRKGEPLMGELRALVGYLRTGERGDLASVEDSLATLEIIAGA